MRGVTTRPNKGHFTTIEKFLLKLYLTEPHRSDRGITQSTFV